MDEDNESSVPKKKLSGKKESPGKEGDKKTPVKEASAEKKKSPEKDDKKEMRMVILMANTLL